MKRYLSATYQAVTPDALGHGENLQMGISHEAWISDLDRLVDNLGDVDVHLVGLSMGGVQAQLYAAQYSGKLASIVLADTFAFLEPDVQAERIDGITERVTNIGMAGHGKAYVEETLMGDLASLDAEHMRSCIAAIPADMYLESVRATFEVDLRGELGKITVPTLVLHGELDVKTPLALSEYMRDNIAGAQLVSLPNAGHLSASDAPQAFARGLNSFIAEVMEDRQKVKIQ